MKLLDTYMDTIALGIGKKIQYVCNSDVNAQFSEYELLDIIAECRLFMNEAADKADEYSDTKFADMASLESALDLIDVKTFIDGDLISKSSANDDFPYILYVFANYATDRVYGKISHWLEHYKAGDWRKFQILLESSCMCLTDVFIGLESLLNSKAMEPIIAKWDTRKKATDNAQDFFNDYTKYVSTHIDSNEFKEFTGTNYHNNIKYLI